MPKKIKIYPSVNKPEPIPGAFGKRLYVAPSGGSDSETHTYCDINHPCATVKYAVSLMIAGDVLYMRGGHYIELAINIQSKNNGDINNQYTILSYPGEWAIIDGNHVGTATNYRCVIQSGAGYNFYPVHYWNFRRFEVTGGGAADYTSVIGAGIDVQGRFCTFSHLYFHDNYAALPSAGGAGGLCLESGSQDNIIEYCYGHTNGNPDTTNVNDRAATTNCNFLLYSDYRYYATVIENSQESPILISSSVAGTPGHIITSSPHGLHDYDFVSISGHSGASPALNGTTYTIRIVNSTEFELTTFTATESFGTDVTITTGGTGGSLVITSTTCRNIVRYCLSDGWNEGHSLWTPVGFAFKGFQRLTGYHHGELENALDALPNDDTYKSQGTDLHHCLLRGHAQGMRMDDDYCQVHHNVVDIDFTQASAAYSDGTTEHWAAIKTRDASSGRRGSFWPSVYNNTVFADEGSAIVLPILGSSWNVAEDGTDCEYGYGFIPNNIVVDASHTYASEAIGTWTEGTGLTGYQPYTPSRFVYSRNLLYNALFPSTPTRLGSTSYSIANIISLGVADILWSKTTPSPFLGSSGSDKYKTDGSYALDGTYTILNGGLSGSHPYRSGVTIPDYLGAIDPNDSGWIDIVMGLSNTTNLMNEVTV